MKNLLTEIEYYCEELLNKSKDQHILAKRQKNYEKMVAYRTEVLLLEKILLKIDEVNSK